MLRREGLLHRRQLDVLAPHLPPAGAVVARRLAVLRVHLPELVVAQLVRDAVQQRGRAVRPNVEVPPRVEIALPGHVVGEDARADAHGPEELVDVVAGVAGEASEDEQDVIDVERLQDRVRVLLGGGEGAADGGDVRVVPRVVVDQDGAVGHGGHLVAVVPPGEDLGVRVGVLAEPKVRLAVVVVPWGGGGGA